MQTCYLRYFGHVWLWTPKLIISTRKKLLFICWQKNYIIAHVFLEILQRYANFLFWILWASLVMHTQNDKMKISMFICMPKINFIIPVFLQKLNFKESCNLRPRILPDNRNGDETSITTLIFIIDYFLVKLMTKFFKKNPKTLFSGPVGPFLTRCGKKWIFLEKRTYRFLDIPIIYHRAKKNKKKNKMPNLQMDIYIYIYIFSSKPL